MSSIMCKFYVSWSVEDVSSKDVVLIDITLVNPREEFTSSEVVSWMMRLGVYWKPFDNNYSKYDIMRAVRNEQYELSFFYSHKASSIYMSAICLEDEALKKLVKLLEELKTLKHGKSVAKEV